MISIVAVAFLLAACTSGGEGASPAAPSGTGQDGTQQLPTDTGSPDTSGQSPLGLAIVGLDGTVQQDLGLPTDAWMPDLSSDGTQIMFLTASTTVGF